MKPHNEALLGAWLRLSTSVNNSRLVSDIPYNESLICNILYHSTLEQPENRLTATDLCCMTKMLKSQMNRTLNQLEDKKMITRERSAEDKRKVYISLNPTQMEEYLTQHAKILELLDAIIDRLGETETKNAIHVMHTISDIAEELF